MPPTFGAKMDQEYLNDLVTVTTAHANLIAHHLGSADHVRAAKQLQSMLIDLRGACAVVETMMDKARIRENESKTITPF